MIAQINSRSTSVVEMYDETFRHSVKPLIRFWLLGRYVERSRGVLTRPICSIIEYNDNFIFYREKLKKHQHNFFVNAAVDGVKGAGTEYC